MEHRIEFGGEPQDVTVTTAGDADPAGFAAFNEDLVGHPAFRPGMAILIDHSALDSVLLTGDDLAAIADHVKAIESRFGGGPIAIVAPDAFLFGLARASVREAGFDRLAPQTFATHEEAVAWLRTLR